MLSSSNRLTSPAQFREVVRRGRRRGGHLVVLHLRLAPSTGATAPLDGAPRVGFVVSRAVGNAVARNLVKRRLRHLLRERLGQLPAGSMLVVRALPPAQAAEYQDLAHEVDRALEALLPATGVDGSRAQTEVVPG